MNSGNGCDHSIEAKRMYQLIQASIRYSTEETSSAEVSSACSCGVDLTLTLLVHR